MLSLVSLLVLHGLLVLVMLYHTWTCYRCDVWGRTVFALLLPEIYGIFELMQRYIWNIDECCVSVPKPVKATGKRKKEYNSTLGFRLGTGLVQRRSGSQNSAKK